MTEKTSDNLQNAYNEQYVSGMSEWRTIGARSKAKNILEVCKGRRFERVLDCGAGEGSLLQCLSKSDLFESVCAIDISESGIAKLRERSLPQLTEAKTYDGYKIPYPDNYFEMAYCSHVIEHVEHPRLLLRELRRVSHLQVLEVPLDYSSYQYLLNREHAVDKCLKTGHLNVYSPAIFRFLLRSEGFDILEETLSRTSDEALRYNRFEMNSEKKTLRASLEFKTKPLKYALKRLLFGKDRYDEDCFHAFTCLTSGNSEIQVLDQVT